MSGIAPKLPISVSKKGTPESTLTLEENTRQNLKNLLLTSPGERVMNPDFGVGLRNFLFENNLPVTRARLESRILEQVEKYMPFVEITDLQIISPSENPNLIDIKLRYRIQNISSDELLSLSLQPNFSF